MYPFYNVICIYLWGSKIADWKLESTSHVVFGVLYIVFFIYFLFCFFRFSGKGLILSRWVHVVTEILIHVFESAHVTTARRRICISDWGVLGIYVSMLGGNGEIWEILWGSVAADGSQFVLVLYRLNSTDGYRSYLCRVLSDNRNQKQLNGV